MRSGRRERREERLWPNSLEQSGTESPELYEIARASKEKIRFAGAERNSRTISTHICLPFVDIQKVNPI